MGSKRGKLRWSRRKMLGYGLSVLGAPLVGFGCQRRRRNPHIVLITLDTTRRDRLGCYGYHLRTTPELDALASQSVLYTRAISPSSWTLPAHASLFTGKFSTSHGARYDPDGPLRLTDAIDAPQSWHLYRARGLAEGEWTLAQKLREAGYVTGAVVGGPWMKKVFGLHRGFDDYDDDLISTVNGRLASEVTSRALEWIESNRGRDVFLFLNYFDPHTPYSAPEPYTYTFFSEGPPSPEKELTSDDLSKLYDAEILYMDVHIGRFLKGLQEHGLYDDTMFIVTADHGELLGEHGRMGHGNTLHQEEIHVPLFIKYPRGEVAPERSDVPIQLVDIPAMILNRVGLPAPESFQGGLPPRVGHPIIAEVYPLAFSSTEGDWRVLFDGSTKLCWNSLGNHLLFDLAKDPREQQNLVAQDPERVKTMSQLLAAYLDSLPKPSGTGPTLDLDDETKRALRALGYVNPEPK